VKPSLPALSRRSRLRKITANLDALDAEVFNAVADSPSRFLEVTMPRSRPDTVAVRLLRRARRGPVSNSWPSGHAATAAAFAAVVSPESPPPSLPVAALAAQPLPSWSR